MMANIKWTRKAAAVVIGLCMASFVLDSFSILPSFTASTPAHHNLRRSLSVAGGGSIRNAVAQFTDPKTTVHKTDPEELIKLEESSRISSLEFPYPLTCDKNEVLQFLQSNNLIDDQTGEKKISVTLVYHVGMVGNWETVVADQFHTLNECGTLDIADQLFLTYSNEDMGTILDFINPLLGDDNRHKLKAIDEAKISPWEAPAMNKILDHCNSSRSPKKEVVFYFHNKGTSRWTEDWRSKVAEPYSYAYSLYWRKYLEYFTIERPQLCLDRLLLGDATSCGPNWREGNGDKYKDPNYVGKHHVITNHYSGNFWSATCEHINHLQPLKSKKYTAGELWIGEWEGHKQAKLTTHFKKLYSNLVVPEEYALQGKKQQMLLAEIK